MIKRMTTEHMQIGRVGDDVIILTINGMDHRLTVDELKELRVVTDHFWSANDLYQWTKEAIADRQRREDEDNGPQQRSMTASGTNGTLRLSNH